jgi:hypothetical protein
MAGKTKVHMSVICQQAEHSDTAESDTFLTADG